MGYFQAQGQDIDIGQFLRRVYGPRRSRGPLTRQGKRPVSSYLERRSLLKNFSCWMNSTKKMIALGHSA